MYPVFVICRYTQNIILSLRIKQWYKNILLFAGIVFSGNLANQSLWLSVILGFLLFCLLSGIGYIVNDIVDKDSDSKHPHKCIRPIASGRLKVKPAIIITSVLTVIVLVTCYMLNTDFFIIGLVYLILTIGYSLILKNLALVDLFAVSLGFVVRAIAGCIIINIDIFDITDYLIICVFFLAMFLTLNKRWYSIKVLKEKYNSFYSLLTLDRLISITTAALLLCYIMYVILSNNHILLISTIFVVYGLFRYLYLVQHLDHQAESENILKDKPLIINIACWLICILTLTRI